MLVTDAALQMASTVAPRQYFAGFLYSWLNEDVFDDLNKCFPADIHLTQVMDDWVELIRAKDWTNAADKESFIAELYSIDLLACKHNKAVVAAVSDELKAISDFKEQDNYE